LHGNRIQASSERVWQILADLARFPQWNPFIRWANGQVKAGARLEVRIQPSGASGMTFKPTVLKAEPTGAALAGSFPAPRSF